MPQDNNPFASGDELLNMNLVNNSSPHAILESKVSPFPSIDNNGEGRVTIEDDDEPDYSPSGLNL
tara:strand:- start:1202 stop:1396 length:195 start_codon:yes stop_codon:yes gene_type:complete